MQGNVSKRAVNLSDLMEGADQFRKMLNLQSLGERVLSDLTNYWSASLVPYIPLSAQVAAAWLPDPLFPALPPLGSTPVLLLKTYSLALYRSQVRQTIRETYRLMD